jgi:hypothetical protein
MEVSTTRAHPRSWAPFSRRSIVVNNGPRKGLGQKVDVKYVTRQGETPASYELNSYLRLAKLPGIEGIWQGHQSLLDADPAHNTTT